LQRPTTPKTIERVTLKLSVLEINVTPLEPKQFTLPQPGGYSEENECAFAEGKMVNHSPYFQGC